MKNNGLNKKSTRLVMVIMLALAPFSGCITFTQHAIPANRLPNQFEAPSKSELLPINFSMLGANAPSEHLLDTGDIFALTIQGVIPADPKEFPPIIQGQQTLAREYYPPNGTFSALGFGIPINIPNTGLVALPLIAPLQARGLTVAEFSEKVRQAYLAKAIMKEGNDQVTVTLLRSRTNRVLVIREDAAAAAIGTIRKGEAILQRRGSAQAVDLPAYESDVLHALVASGGLPGVEATNEVWILRKNTLAPHAVVQVREQIDNGGCPQEVINQLPAHLEAIRIPLKLCPNQPIPFTPEDVMLQDGDIVYIEPRRDDYFYTGGLLPGGQLPMPRDEDLDIIEAVALANGSVGGLGGTSSVSVLRAGAGLGNIIPPSRVLILRKLPNGDQLPIRVDLAKAMRDPTERIQIMAGDYIMLYCRPGEMMANGALNFFNVNVSVRQQ